MRSVLGLEEFELWRKIEKTRANYIGEKEYPKVLNLSVQDYYWKGIIAIG